MHRSAARRLMLLVAAVSLTFAACSDDGPDIAEERSAQVRASAIDAGLDVDVATFLGDISRGDLATYRVSFPGRVEGDVLVITNRQDQRRIEVRSNDVLTEVRLRTDGQAFVCTANDGIDQGRCRRTDALVEPPGVFPVSAVDTLTDALVRRLEDFDLVIETLPVAGVEATCLVARIRTGRERSDLADGGTICASAEGVLLLVDQGGQRLEAISYSTDVDDDPFTRPDER